MKVLRIIGVVLICILLFASLMSLGTTETLEKSTKFKNVEEKFTSLSRTFIKESIDLEPIIKQALPFMKAYCTNNTVYSLKQNGYSFNISCDSINKGTDAIIDNIIDETVSSFIKNYYYENYECEFIDCLRQNKPLVLISEKAHEYWKDQSNLLLLVSLGLAIILFFLTKRKTNFFILAGGLTTLTGIVVSQLPEIASNIARTAFSPASSMLTQLGASSDIFMKVAKAFFSQAENVYIWFILIGIALIVFGILSKIFNIIEKITKLFPKSKKKKEESE